MHALCWCRRRPESGLHLRYYLHGAESRSICHLDLVSDRESRTSEQCKSSTMADRYEEGAPHSHNINGEFLRVEVHVNEVRVNAGYCF